MDMSYFVMKPFTKETAWYSLVPEATVSYNSCKNFEFLDEAIEKTPKRNFAQLELEFDPLWVTQCQTLVG